MADTARFIDRRAFLRHSALVAGAVAFAPVLEACSKAAGPKTPRTLGELIAARKAAGAKQDLSVFLGGEDYVESMPNYAAFGMADIGGRPVIGADATVWIAQGSTGEALAGPFSAPWAPYTKPDALPPAPQGLNHLDLTFAQAGMWQMLVDVQTSSGRSIGTTAVQVKAKGKTDTRVAGDRAIASQTPTVDNPRGVHPICTRTPPCPFHAITLAKAMTLGKPVAFMVGTPRFCMSRTCGPNLEELILVSKQVRDRAGFVHAEVYRSDKAQDIQSQATSLTFRRWGMQSEPWLFLIDKTGGIRKRFEGPVVKPIILEALTPLLA